MNALLSTVVGLGVLGAVVATFVIPFSTVRYRLGDQLFEAVPNRLSAAPSQRHVFARVQVSDGSRAVYTTQSGRGLYASSSTSLNSRENARPYDRDSAASETLDFEKPQSCPTGPNAVGDD